MITFKEANQIRIQLKMKLASYSWYVSSGVFTSAEDYYIGVFVKKIDNNVRKIISPTINDISVRIFES